jgi:hypothetical protein
MIMPTNEKSQLMSHNYFLTYFLAWTRLLLGSASLIGRLDFLGHHVTALERQFGSGAASFFRLIRYFIITNLIGL